MSIKYLKNRNKIGRLFCPKFNVKWVQIFEPKKHILWRFFFFFKYKCDYRQNTALQTICEIDDIWKTYIYAQETQFNGSKQTGLSVRWKRLYTKHQNILVIEFQ